MNINLSNTLCTTFHQNQPSFAEDMTKLFWLTFYQDTLLDSHKTPLYKVVCRHYWGKVKNITTAYFFTNIPGRDLNPIRKSVDFWQSYLKKKNKNG